jgi:metallo-beta-lactamase class B
MWRKVFIATLAAVAAVGFQAELGAQAPEGLTAEKLAASAEAQRHIAAAMALAGDDLQTEAEALCSAQGAGRAALVRPKAGLPEVADHELPPTRMFENLYFIGFNDVGAWAIDTSEGLILIDSLNSPAEARDVLIPGIEQVGLDPNEIEYIIVGHGHNDHVGGAKYLQDTYGARILLTAEDWDLALSGERPDRPRPRRDIEVTDGYEVTLGDTTVTLVQTPGHTAGSLAMIVPVRHQGQTHRVMIFSGTQMPTLEHVAVFEHVYDDFARPLRVEAALSGHPGVANLLTPAQREQCLRTSGPCWTSGPNTLETQAQLRARYPTGPHPLLMGEDRFGRYYSILMACASAKIAAME